MKGIKTQTEQKMVTDIFSGKTNTDNIPLKESILFDLLFIYQNRDLTSWKCKQKAQVSPILNPLR